MPDGANLFYLMNFEKEDKDALKVLTAPACALDQRQHGYLSSQRTSNECLDQVDVQRIAWSPLIASASHAATGHQTTAMSKDKQASYPDQVIEREKMMNAADEPDRSTAFHHAHDASTDKWFVDSFALFN